jgi:tetratricopeptide (TPR) repeat protein
MKSRNKNTELSAIQIVSVVLLFISIAIWPAGAASGQAMNDYRKIDSLTYKLYEQGDWKALTKTGNEALDQGVDFYYLRMRIALAYFYREQYRLAAGHFRQALQFNKEDPFARKYLYKSLDWGGLEVEAARLLKKMPATDSMVNPLKKLSVFYGKAFSGNMKAIDALNLDGESNIYGEVTGNGDMAYFHAGATFAPVKHLRWFAGYTNLLVEKHQRAIMDGKNTLDHAYNLRQHHFAARLPIRIGEQLQLIPSIDLITGTETPLLVTFDTLTYTYQWEKQTFTYNNHILGVKIFKDWSLVSLGAALSKSNFQSSDQWQGSLIAGVYPAGNLNLYAFSTLSFLMENNITKVHFKQTAGAKILSRLWLQGSTHFGQLKNAHDESSLLVFNTFGQVVSRTTASAMILISEKIIFHLDYSFMKHKDKYLVYLDYDTYIWNTFTYNNHHIMGGIKWTL